MKKVNSYCEILEELYYEKRLRQCEIASLFKVTPCAVHNIMKNKEKKEFNEKEFFLSHCYKRQKLAEKIVKNVLKGSYIIEKNNEGYFFIKEITCYNGDINYA